MRITPLLPATLLSLVTALPAFAGDTEKTSLCVEAEERYVDMFGHASSEEEDVTVVTMYKYNFCPAEITVPAGTTVRWVNVDKRTSHSVLSPDAGMPESDRAFPEEFVEFTFLEPGAAKYLCGPHWETQKMLGMVTVEE